MSETAHGTDRSCRRAKRFLTPSQKYEMIWLQLVRQEVTMPRPRPATVGPVGDHVDPHRGERGALAARAASKHGARPGSAPRARGRRGGKRALAEELK